MRIVVHTLAVDDDGGTQTFGFATEQELLQHLFENVIEASHYDEKPKPTFEEFCEDPTDYLDTFKSDYLDTYSWDYTVLEIPLWRIILDSWRLR